MGFNRISQRKFYQFSLIFGDFIFLFLAFLIARFIRFGIIDFNFIKNPIYWSVCFILLLFHYIFGLYEQNYWKIEVYSVLRSGVALLFGSIGVFIFNYISSPTIEKDLTGRGVFLLAVVSYYVLHLIFRKLISLYLYRHQARAQWLLVSNLETKNKLVSELEKNKISVDLIWLDSQTLKDSISGLVHRLENSWFAVIIDSSVSDEGLKAVMNARMSGQIIFSIENFYEMYFYKLPVESLEPYWFVFSSGFSILQSRVRIKFKRATDIIISAFLIVLTFPLMLLICALIKLTSKGKIVFRQRRIGENQRVFTIYKFRTMKERVEKGSVWTQENDPRITIAGHILRKTRLDELPQLFNIFRGDMSFIGPRPEMVELSQQYSKEIPYYGLRHLVKPGLSGWAQINYPYGASLEDAIQKLHYDLFYIKNFSLVLDLIVFLKTISVVILGKGR